MASGKDCRCSGRDSFVITSADSRTKGKKITIPATILELPPLKIYSVRFYKENKVVSEIIIDNSDKELKRTIKLSKKTGKIEDVKKEFDDLRIMIYSINKKAGIKKKPDFTEVGLGGSLEDKLAFVKEHSGKEINVIDLIKEVKLVDVRGLTRGKGIQGPVKRFGIKLKSHKSEKGRRNPGSIGPWHPAHTTFRVPMAGQLGMFTRVVYNSHILESGKINEKDINPKQGFRHFGNIKTNYLILNGSVQGPVKRQVLLTLPLRPNKKQTKKNYEVIKIE